MPRKSSDLKTELVATRVTPSIKRVVSQEAKKMGLDISEWLRLLIISEIRKMGMMTQNFDEF